MAWDTGRPLRLATDDLLEALAPLVAADRATADPPPWDDPSAFYEPGVAGSGGR